MPYSSERAQHFGGTYCLHLQDGKKYAHEETSRSRQQDKLASGSLRITRCYAPDTPVLSDDTTHLRNNITVTRQTVLV